MNHLVVQRSDFGSLFDVLVDQGYGVIGPTVRDGAIVYEPLASTDDLPEGWTEVQDAGTYRLRRREDDALFGFTVGPDSWKKFLFPPRTQLLEVRRTDGTLAFSASDRPETKWAFLGVRACDLAAVAIQDRVFLESGPADRTYADGRSGTLMIGLNCMEAGGTCFCVSMGTGPRCTSGYDLVLTEIIGDARHEFVFEAGTDTGERILGLLPGRPARDTDMRHVDGQVAATAAQMGRALDNEGMRDLLFANQEHPRWDDVAERCLSCANCTLACPTCFCSSVEDATSLDGTVATRARRWDSCFTSDFSALGGLPVRNTTKERYRQWMTHKLAGWYDQFGTSGCVGCGRCITWCPVGIDLTEEAAAIRASSGGEP